MTVNIIKYNDILFYTFNAQAVNYLSPYAGFRLPPLWKHVMSTFCYIHNKKIRYFFSFYFQAVYMGSKF